MRSNSFVLLLSAVQCCDRPHAPLTNVISFATSMTRCTRRRSGSLMFSLLDHAIQADLRGCCAQVTSVEVTRVFNETEMVSKQVPDPDAGAHHAVRNLAA